MLGTSARAVDTTSGDVDLIVDNMKAVEFAALLMQYRPTGACLQLMTATTLPRTDGSPLRGLAHADAKGGKVIAKRPEQHKEVEVVALKLLDGPPVELSSHFGHSPEEEARRRDFTINALFYNVNHDQVEDLTGAVRPHESKSDAWRTLHSRLAGTA